MNIRVKKLIRQYCPNIAPLRNWMAEKKLKEYRDHFMDAATVAECEKIHRTGRMQYGHTVRSIRSTRQRS